MTIPDDARLRAYHFAASVTGAEILAKLVAAGDAPAPGVLRLVDSELERHADGFDRVWLRAFLCDLARARSKSSAKFLPRDTENMLGEVSMLEQASGHRVATYKAQRFARFGVHAMLDVCCGLGGDTRALVREFGAAAVFAIDRDAAAAFVTENATGCRSLVGDACTELRRAIVLARADGDTASTTRRLRIGTHIDPARRSEGKRRGASLEALEPGLEECLDAVLEVAHDGDVVAFKLAPGLDATEVLGHLHTRAGIESVELEWIAEPEGLVQAVLWISLRTAASLARVTRRATRILASMPESMPAGAGATVTFAMEPGACVQRRQDPNYEDIDQLAGRVLIEPDPVLERSGVLDAWLAEHAPTSRELWPGLGLYVDRDDGGGSGFAATRFRCRATRILAASPWRPKKVRALLDARRAQVREFRTRGRAVEFDEARAIASKASARDPDRDAVDLWGLRLGRRRIALLTESAVRSWS
ncbi:MAG: hypothetical protein KDC95_18670 [Planctomycetes bacterium]|nr:hypothetical protein [Planctomycetota bacterium]